jgi:carboxymethylenebutenolidase
MSGGIFGMKLWEEHMRYEFQACSTEDTLATMVEDSYVNHVPVTTGGVGHAELRQFYATHQSGLRLANRPIDRFL